MSELAITVITPGDDLAVSEANGYRVLSLTAGPRVWERVTVSSPFVHGSIEVSRRLGQQVASLSVVVSGSTLAEVETRYVALRDALELQSYTLDVTISGTLNYQWACTGADSAPGDGGSIEAADLLANEQLFAFTIFRHPIPLAGSL